MLELLLISLRRDGSASPDQVPQPKVQPHQAESYVQAAIAYMKENLTQPICLEDICAHAAISRAQLQKVFRSQTGDSVMRYLSRLRIDEAKYLIRSGNMSFTEIAELLCYSSVHHFSKQFRAHVGMSPREYVASIQAVTREPIRSLPTE